LTLLYGSEAALQGAQYCIRQMRQIAKRSFPIPTKINLEVVN
jgi:hypothetical protein